MAAPIYSMPLTIKPEYGDEDAATPVSARSAPLVQQPPISPYGPATSTVSEPMMMFPPYSPEATEALAPLGATTPTVPASIPRSVPRTQYDAYMG